MDGGKASMVIRRKVLLILLVSLFVLGFVRFNIPQAKAQGTITQTFTSQSYDGYIAWDWNVYSVAHDAVFGEDSDEDEQIIIGQSLLLGKYYVDRGFFFFDTSTIPNNVNITEVKISLYLKNDYSTTDFNVTIQNGQPYYPHKPIVATDYYHTHYSGDGGQLDTSDLVAGYNNITFTEDGIGWINLEDVTKLCLRSSRDINSNEPSGNESVWFYAAEKGSEYTSKLYVTFETYQYAFHGLFNEDSGLLYSPSERAVNVTAYYIDETSETFEVNGTYTYNTSEIPLYFLFDLSTQDREYWLGEDEINIDIYVFNQSLTTYTISFLDLAGALDDYPLVEAQRYVNGSLMTIEKRKVDAENKISMNLITGVKYNLVIKDGSSYTFGDVLMTSTTTFQLVLKGIEFPKETLLTCKYVHIYGYRHTWNEESWYWDTPSAIHSECGESDPYFANKTIDESNTTYWTHTALCYHWIIMDMGETKTITKIRLYQGASTAYRFGTSTGFQVYVGDDPEDLGDAVWEGALDAAGWQETGNFSKNGRYIKLLSESDGANQRIYEFDATVYIAPTSSITIVYEDTLEMTISVTIYINYRNGTNAYNATETSDSFVHTWSLAWNTVDYAVVVEIDHNRYGLTTWKNYFPRRFFSEPPWSLDFLGTLPFVTSTIIPSLLIIFAAGCFTVINAEVGAVLAVVVAMVLAYLGWIAIPAAVLLTAFTLAVLMAIIYAKRRVQT